MRVLSEVPTEPEDVPLDPDEDDELDPPPIDPCAPSLAVLAQRYGELRLQRLRHTEALERIAFDLGLDRRMVGAALERARTNSRIAGVLDAVDLRSRQVEQLIPRPYYGA